jgi:large subunit ribosomal protein L13
MKTETFASLQERIPERIVEKAIKGMLPHNALGRQMFRKLKVYKGSEHPHSAQKPQPLQLNPSASAQ